MPIAGTRIPINTAEGMDKITHTEKVTSPYFSNGATVLAAANIRSSSLSDTNEKYFFGISHNTTLTTQEFNVAFGSTNGYGGDSSVGKIKSPTEAIYKQYASMLLAPMEVTGGFKISQGGSHAAKKTSKDTEIFVLSATRTNMKDRINKGTWTVALSGSLLGGGGDAFIKLTDDSKTTKATATPVGDRYNIVSGAAGTVHNAATSQSFGYFYPNVGILVFSGHELSSSIGGKEVDRNDTVIFGDATHAGFAFPTGSLTNSKTALRFINCLKAGGSLTFRDEEDQVSAQYFCRTRAGHNNFSNNPTFVSGSLNELRSTKMKGNPQTFITQVQLYNDDGHMVAVGSLSTPLKKNFSSEATIKVKLTY